MPEQIQKTQLIGVIIIGNTLIILAVLQMIVLLFKASVYLGGNDYQPYWTLIAKYIYFWIICLLGIISGIGLLTYKKISCQLALIVAILTIVTFLGTNPYQSLKRQIRVLSGVVVEQQFNKNKLIASVGMFTVNFGGFLFYSFTLFYLTRPRVKVRFLEIHDVLGCKK